MKTKKILPLTKIIFSYFIIVGSFNSLSFAEKDGVEGIVSTNPTPSPLTTPEAKPLPRILPEKEIKAKLVAFSQLMQLVGMVKQTSVSLQHIAEAANNEAHQSDSHLVWFHVLRIRRLGGDALSNHLRGILPADLDPSLKALVMSALESLLNEGSRPTQKGSAAYWQEQITRLQLKQKETAATLNTAADLIFQKANLLRDEAMGLMKKILENPEGLHDSIKVLYAEQVAELNQVEALYAEKLAQLEAPYQAKKAALTAAFDQQKKALDIELAEIRNATLREPVEKLAAAEEQLKAKTKAIDDKYTAAEAKHLVDMKGLTEKFAKATDELKEKFAKATTDAQTTFNQQKAKLEADIAVVQKSHTQAHEEFAASKTKATAELKTVTDQTAVFLRDAAAAQKRLDDARAAIETMITKLKPVEVRGSLVITHNVSSDQGLIVENIINRLIAALREYSDPELWDNIRPAFQVKIEGSLSNLENHITTGQLTVRFTMQIGRDKTEFAAQTFPVRYKRNTPVADFSDLTGLRAAASALAPDMLRALQVSRSDEWEELAKQAVSVCETHLHQIVSQLPSNPNLKR